MSYDRAGAPVFIAGIPARLFVTRIHNGRIMAHVRRIAAMHGEWLISAPLTEATFE